MEEDDDKSGELGMISPQGSRLALNKPMWLGDIAAVDPKLAWTLLEAGRAPGGYVDTGGWEVIPLQASWTSGTADTNISGQTNGIIEADMWVRKVTYTVRRPVAFAGSVFKSMSDYYNMKQPNIDFTLEIKSYTNYLIATSPVPLETIENVFDCVCPAGLVLRCNSQIKATFTNLRAWADPGEVPVNVAVVLHAVRLPTGLYGTCGADQARAVLKELGQYK